jgi:hypothetical protein
VLDPDRDGGDPFLTSVSLWFGFEIRDEILERSEQKPSLHNLHALIRRASSEISRKPSVQSFERCHELVPGDFFGRRKGSYGTLSLKLVIETEKIA